MKKKNLIIFVMAFLIVIVTAQVVFNIRDIDIALTRDEKIKLAEYNISTPETTPLVCDVETCEFRMYQVLNRFSNETYGLGTHRFERGNLNRVQLEAKQDKIIKDWLSGYVEVLKDRESRSIEIVSNSTNVTIIESR